MAKTLIFLLIGYAVGGIIQIPKGENSELLDSGAFFTGRDFLDSHGKEKPMMSEQISQESNPRLHVVALTFSSHNEETEFAQWLESVNRAFDVEMDFQAACSQSQDRLENGLLL